jgi:hypothetical protein
MHLQKFSYISSSFFSQKNQFILLDRTVDDMSSKSQAASVHDILKWEGVLCKDGYWTFHSTSRLFVVVGSGPTRISTHVTSSTAQILKSNPREGL